MTVLTLPGYPGGNRITIATWFKVLDNSLNDFGVSYGAGYDYLSHDVPTGGTPSHSDHNANYSDGSYIPLCEWGYSADAGSATGPVQAVSGLYLDSAFGEILFVARGPFYDDVSFATAINPTAEGPQLLDEGGVLDLSYATVSLSCFGGGNKPRWVQDAWNVLVLSADLSIADTLSGGFGHTLTTLAHYTVNKPIWMNLNNVFDAAGSGGGSFEQGYPIAGGEGTYHGFYQIQRNPNNLGPILWVGQPDLTMMTGDFSEPCLEAFASAHYNYAPIVRAYTQVWFDLYIDPTTDNIAKFFTPKIINGQSKLVPSALRAAQSAFGPSDVWLYRDKKTGVKYQDNKGTAGPFSIIGNSPADYTPGPGQ